MERAFQLRLFGIPLTIRPSFLLVLTFLALPTSWNSSELLRFGLWLVIAFASILWHELGHVLVMRIFGGSPRIELYSLGGLTHWGSDSDRSSWARLCVSLAGPLAGFVLGGATLFFSHWFLPSPGSFWGWSSSYLIWINLSWGAVNLLPLLPLDGGEALSVLLEKASPTRGRQATRWISVIVAVGLATYAFAAWWPWLVVLAAWAGLNTFREAREVAARDHDDPLWSRLAQALQRLRESDFDEAMAMAKEVRAQARSASLRTAAAEQMAWALVLQGKPAEARGVLRAHATEVPPSHLIEGAIALDLEELTKAQRHLRIAHDESPSQASLNKLVAVEIRLEELDVALSLFDGFAASHDEQVLRMTTDTLGVALYESERFQEAARIYRARAEQGGDARDLFNVACCLARDDQPEEAIDWLLRAANEGVEATWLEEDPDLESLRAHPRWKELKSVNESDRPSSDRRG